MLPPLPPLGVLSAGLEVAVEVAGVDVDVVGLAVPGVVGAVAVEVAGLEEVVGAVVLQAGSVLSLATPVPVEVVQLEPEDPEPAVLLLLPPIAPCRNSHSLA